MASHLGLFIAPVGAPGWNPAAQDTLPEDSWCNVAVSNESRLLGIACVIYTSQIDPVLTEPSKHRVIPETTGMNDICSYDRLSGK